MGMVGGNVRGGLEADGDGGLSSLTTGLGQTLTPPVMMHRDDDDDGKSQQSSWIMDLCSARFFEPCVKHSSLKKNECNHFCSCCISTHGPMCRHCLAEHRCTSVTNWKQQHGDNIMFQIRMYMYKYVVHLDDLNKHFDASGVQAYCINQKKAVLLAPKEASVGSAGIPVFDNRCATCCVPLRPDCRFCSLVCKATNVNNDMVMLVPSTPTSSKKKRRGLSRQSSQNSELSSFQDVSSSRSVNGMMRGSVLLFGKRPAGRRRKLSTPMRSWLE